MCVRLWLTVTALVLAAGPAAAGASDRRLLFSSLPPDGGDAFLSPLQPPDLPVPTKGSAAVIGAGVSGVSAARVLAREGYSVTILEAESIPGGVITTWQHPDGRAYDVSAMFIPTGHAGGPGQSPKYHQFLHEAGMLTAMHEVRELYGLNPDGSSSEATPAWLVDRVLAGEGQDVIDDLVRGLNLLIDMSECPTQGVWASEACGVAELEPTPETRVEWGDARDVAAFVSLSLLPSDLLLSGPAIASFAAHWLFSACKFSINGFARTVAGVVEAMTALGQQPTLPPNTSPGVRALIELGGDVPIYNHFAVGGFQALLERSIAAWGFTTHYNTRVTRVEPSFSLGTPVRITTADGSVTSFDVVVCAVPPHLLPNLFPAEDRETYPAALVEMIHSYEAIPLTSATWSAALRVSNLGQLLPVEAGILVTEDALGTAELGDLLQPDHPRTLNNAVTSLIRFYLDSDIIIVGGYCSAGTDLEDVLGDAIPRLESKTPLVVSEVLMSARYDGWPYRPNNATAIGPGLVSKIIAAEGVGKVFTVGEVLTGPAVPAILEAVESELPKYLAAAEND